MATTCHAQEDLFSQNLQKRYHGLLTVRMRAMKGKGAWYWSHLEPILVQNQETGTARAIRLRCRLCNALFAASNPSRTATEHLKSRTCPNLNGGLYNAYQRSNRDMPGVREYRQVALPVTPLSMVPAPCSTEPMAVSSTEAPQDEGHITAALDLLADWFYDSCGYISFSSLHHPKFKSFLQQIGLPEVSRAHLTSQKLHSRYLSAKLLFDEKLRDTMFFQLSIEGWKKKEVTMNYAVSAESYFSVMLNLPNGSTLFHKVVVVRSSKPPADYMKDVIWSLVRELSGGDVLRCVGTVSDIGSSRSQVLRELELQNHRMVNLTCQSNAFFKLLKDLFKTHPLYTTTISLCHKITQHIKALRSRKLSPCHPEAALPILEAIAQSSQALHETIAAGTFCDDPSKKEVYDIIQDSKFWEDLHAILCLTKLVKKIAKEVQEERPRLGQCLPLWEEAKSRIKSCSRSLFIDDNHVMELVNRRFMKNYNQAWSASFILDPINLMEDSRGRYVPPFKFLTLEQEKDIVEVITRMSSKEEAPIALMELMKWRTEGLDPVYAKAVQAKDRDPATGKMRIMNPCASRLVWEIYLTEFKMLRKIATRLIFLQVTTSRLAMNRSVFSRLCSKSQSRSSTEKAQKLVFIASNGKLERKQLMDDDDEDLFDSEENVILGHF